MTRKHCKIISAMALGAALLAASPSLAQSAKSTTLWEARWQYVRLTPRDGGEPNKHPAALAKAEIRSALAQLKLDTGDGEPVQFLTPEEREFYGDQVGKALAKAGPDTDVTVATSGLRKTVLGLQEPKITTVRVFRDEAGLNVIVGEALTDSPAENTYVKVDPRLVSFTDGARAAPAKASAKWKLVAAGPGVTIKRADWAVIPAAAMTQPEPGSPEAQESVQKQVQQLQRQMQQMQQMPAPAATMPPAGVEQRLRALEDLRAKGLVSPEEYSAKRKQILDSL